MGDVDDLRVEAVLRGDIDEDVVADLVGEALDDPRRVEAWGQALLAAEPEPVVASVGHQLVGAAAMAAARPDDAATSFGAAVALLDGEVDRAARGDAVAARSAACLASLAPSLMYLGRFDEAKDALARATERCAASQRPRIDGQHAAVLDVLGRSTEALALYARALPALRSAGDVAAEGRARTNRAILLAQLGRVDEARADLERARVLSRQLGAALALALLDHTEGWVASLEGDVVGALAAFDEFDRKAADLGVDDAIAMRTRADVLLLAGLPEEARVAAGRAAASFDAHGEVVSGERARLVAARAALQAGDAAASLDLARRVRQQLTSQGRSAQAAQATVLLAEAELAVDRERHTRGAPAVAPSSDDDAFEGPNAGADARSVSVSTVTVAAIAAAANTLADVGWPDEHARARSVAVRLALQHGDMGAAERHAQRLQQPVSSAVQGDLVERRSGGDPSDHGGTAIGDGGRSRARRGVAPALARTVSVNARVLSAEARARLAAANGAVEAALKHVASGLAFVDEHRAALGATDLRTGASSLAADLTFLGLTLAIEHEPAERVWWWAEQTRAAALRRPPVRPPEDAELRGALARLRDTAASIDRAVGSGDDTSTLVSRQQDLEREVTALARRARDDGRDLQDAGDLGESDVTAALDDRVLVELLAVGDRVHGLVVWTRPPARGGPRWMAGSGAAAGPERGAVAVRLRDLGRLDEVAGLAEQADHGLRRLAFGHGAPRVLDAVRTAFEATVARLDALLVAPLLAAAAEGADLVAPVDRHARLVVVPSSRLHALPWAALPSLRGRTVEVAPSATIWARAAGRRAAVAGRPATVALVAGPDLAHADQEVAELAALHPDSVVLASHASTAEATLAAMDAADVAHLACHGEWRSDQPLFSALRLADGPLTVHDLTGLDDPPHTILLSACELGRSQVRPGEELLGLATSLLGMGAATVVASSVPVADAAVRSLMIDVHTHLAAGAGPAAALRAAAADRLDADDHTAWAAAASMLVLGAG